ncbi:MAG TPA: hypothetical protein VER17_20740 [Tepidisphaeraceae bacterium]|nr:hypothetical protein [Tepidisphaeraceae bacterium]
MFTILLSIILSYALVPGMQAATQPTISEQEKRTLVAWYRLLLMVVLFVLFAGLVLTFRFGRLFFPRTPPPRTRTQYVDAWAEAAKRVQVPPAGDDDEDDDDNGPDQRRP